MKRKKEFCKENEPVKIFATLAKNILQGLKNFAGPTKFHRACKISQSPTSEIVTKLQSIITFSFEL